MSDPRPAPTFDSFLAAAWDAHAQATEAVARQLQDPGIGLVGSEADLSALSRLALHVHGAHLGQWDAGIAFQQALAARPEHRFDRESGATLRRHVAALRLAGHADAPDPAAFDASEQVRIAALAAGVLVSHSLARAAALLEQAVAGFEAAALPGSDPAARALAVAGNNLAAELEERADRSEAERALMLQAAETGLRFWALAGGWLETERAHYRLSHSARLAGDAARARQQARACLAIVAAQGDNALERFFGLEALALAEAAAGDTAAAQATVTAAQAAFDALGPDDQGWCRATLDRLPR